MAAAARYEPRVWILLYYGGGALSRVSWGNAAKVSVGCLAAPVILLFLLCCAIYYGPDKHQVTKHARTEWSREFRKVGLDEVPEHAKYAGGASIAGIHGYWTFKVDAPTMRQWLSRSQSLRTAKVITKPGKKAYLFYAPAAHRACLVMVLWAPHWNPPMKDGEAYAQVDTTETGVRKRCSNGETRLVKDAKEALEDLAYLRDHSGVWAEN